MRNNNKAVEDNFFSRNIISLMVHKSILICFVLIIFGLEIRAQNLALFENEEHLELVKKGGDYIYNMQLDSASIIIEQVENVLPGHPIVYLMKALSIGWQEMPLRTTSKVFNAHIEALDSVIITSEKLQEEIENHPEGVFFEMSARGLKAEYYAREGNYMRSLGEARRTYTLIKKGFELVDENPEFLFMVGLYNYFRQMYPQRHTVYKPFMWVFKSGNIEKGLIQMDSATRVGILTKIEAHLYISYIYLRYEDDAPKAKKYIENLVKEYPNNSYFQSKLVECYFMQDEFEEALPYINILMSNKDSYYRMCAEVFYAIYLEKEQFALGRARVNYERALRTGQDYIHKGLYFRSLAYVGLGRIYAQQNNKILARDFFEKAIEVDESENVTKEAKSWIKELKK